MAKAMERDAFILQVPVAGLPKAVLLKFEKDEPQMKAERVKRALESQPREAEIVGRSLESEDIVKIR